MNRFSLEHALGFAALAAVLVGTAGCSSAGPGLFILGGDDAGLFELGDSSKPDAGGTHSQGVPGTDAGNSATPEASLPGTLDSGHTGSHDTGVTMSSGMDSGGGVTTTDNSDGFAAARTACINEINSLRATEGHAALMIWDTPAVDACVDEEATSDEASGVAHQAWNSGSYPVCMGTSMAQGQDECEGYGTDAAGIVACLQSMWNERLQPNCTGCAACSATPYDGSNCPNCDYDGTQDPAAGECGHYVNMSADYFTLVACGFSTSPGGSWATQNFQ